MARKLPWLTDTDGAKHDGRSGPANPAKRQRVAPKEQQQDISNLDLQPKMKLVPREALKSPSSSPPPMLAPSASPLRPGLQADDIYVMVEDEFLATAQTFTKHLHHATYREIKRKARERRANDDRTIVRPTDGVTRMGAELKQRKRARDLQSKTKKGLDTLLTSAARNRAQGSDDSDSDFDVNKLDPPDDGWQGTQLHSFVMTSPQENFKSLIGLQRIKSHTRAAAGFQKVGNGTIRAASPIGMSDDDDTTDTDDLDGPVIRKAKSSKVSQGEQAKRRNQALKPVSTSRPVEDQPRQLAEFDSSDEPDFARRKRVHERLLTSKLSERKPASSLNVKLKARQDKERSKREEHEKPRVEEIPLFM